MFLKEKPAMNRTSRTAERILVVDDHAQARESMCDALGAVGYVVESQSNAPAALNRLEHESYDVVITDLQMPGMTGLEFMRQLAQRPHGAQIIMVTAHATVATAVEAMRHGAFDYLEKPFGIEQLEQVVNKALARGQALDQAALAAPVTNASPALIGDSAVMRDLRARIAQIARTTETALITGESGTGKELVARALHAQSGRAGKPLIGLNCPVLSAQLLESELFGHERGAFTGADTARAGRFELADRGTILLDEISEIELSLQAKLLRVLQEKSFERVGSSKTMRVDVRVLATSNRDLPQEIAAGRFREDLYYRLAVVPVTLPPLRQRREDLPELTAHFLRAAAARLERAPCELEPAALELLGEYHWPGNVRELENLMTRAAVLSAETRIRAEMLRDWLPRNGNRQPPQVVAMPSLTASHLPTTEYHSQTADNAPVILSMNEMERQLIESTLERFGGHRAKTAAALGIGVRTLSGKLKMYGYSPREKPAAKSA